MRSRAPRERSLFDAELVPVDGQPPIERPHGSTKVHPQRVRIEMAAYTQATLTAPSSSTAVSNSKIRLRRSRTTTRTHSDPSESTRLSEEAQIIVDASEAYPAQTSVDYSFARSGFSNQCERALNEQINVEYNISYVYHAMWAYFNRDNIALAGFAEHFRKESLEERAHAEQLMEYMNLRGGKVELQQLLPPQSEYDHPEKGCALLALELSLSLEKLNKDKLCELHRVAEDAGDAHMCDFIEGELLDSQVQSVRQVSEMVATLLRMGPPADGMATWHFDQTLLEVA